MCALTLAKDMGFQNIEIEGDALSIVMSLQSAMVDISPIGTIIEKGRRMD